MNSAEVDEVTLDSERIKLLLCSNNGKYTIISNPSAEKKKLSWWKVFGFPAILDENNIPHRIFGYVSCFKCFQTFMYSSRSGTTRFKEHENKCIRNISALSSPLISLSSEETEIDQYCISSIQSTLAHHGFKKSTKLNDKDMENMKKLAAQWMCVDLRPFSIIEDNGFRAIAQELIRIGHRYGVVDVNDVLRGHLTAAQTIYDLADSYREFVKQKLIEPIQQRAVTICPDFWSDPYKNISYLGLNISFVDNKYQYYSIDLFCRPFFGVKSGDLVVKTLEAHLQEFGINNLSLVNILCDRGSNFVKGFRDYDPIFCYAHRLNNILKASFFQRSKKKKRVITSISTVDADTLRTSTTVTKEQMNPVINENDSESSEESDMDEYVSTSLPVIRKRKQKSDDIQFLVAATVDDLSTEAKVVLTALLHCKRVVKFIKKSGLNKEIERNGGVTVHQATDARWLSIMESLESILKSFKIIKKVLTGKQQQKLVINLNEKIIKQLLLLLTPFQKVIKLVQVGKSASLHMVLLCTETLRDALKSYESLTNYYSNHDDRVLEESGEIADDLLEPVEGITFFLNRLRNLLNEMLILDVRHYAATVLHPKYRSLKLCTSIERSECYHYIRQQLQMIDLIPNETKEQKTKEPSVKRFKGDPFRRFESDDVSTQQASSGESGNESEEYSFADKKIDELDRYLSLELDKSKLSSDPLNFWKDQQEKFPRLSRLARSILSIPATAAGVERDFSAAGLVVQERRTNLNPEQLDNILLVRSMQQYPHLLQ